MRGPVIAVLSVLLVVFVFLGGTSRPTSAGIPPSSSILRTSSVPSNTSKSIPVTTAAVVASLLPSEVMPVPESVAAALTETDLAETDYSGTKKLFTKDKVRVRMTGEWKSKRIKGTYIKPYVKPRG